MWPEAEVIDFRRYLKRRNLSPHTVRCYEHHLKLFFTLTSKPVLEVTTRDVLRFIEQLQGQGRKAKTINCYLNSLRQLYEFWRQEQDIELVNPVHPKYFLKQEDPLPSVIAPEALEKLLSLVKQPRDRAIFLLMLRSGLRVQEVAGLQHQDCDLLRQRLLVRQAKNRRERIVYLSPDTLEALQAYLCQRPTTAANEPLLLGRKGRHKMKGLSVRAIQKLLERYRCQAGLSIHCHQLRHTFASDLLTAGADLVVVQDLLGHRQVQTTQNYCRVANEKVRADYFQAMERIMS
jgi:site-specific recombinase XerD